MSNVIRLPEPAPWVLWSVADTKRYATLEAAQRAAWDSPVAHIGWLLGGRYDSVAFVKNLGSEDWIDTPILSLDEMLEFLDLDKKDAA